MDFQVRTDVVASPPHAYVEQVDGFNWLCDNWWNKQPCILADEMGLVGIFLTLIFVAI